MDSRDCSISAVVGPKTGFSLRKVSESPVNICLDPFETIRNIENNILALYLIGVFEEM
jgi:hypothetical protein